MPVTRDDLPAIVVDTSDVAAVRAPAGRGASTSVYALAYASGVLAFIAIGVYQNAWLHRSVGTSFLLAALWVVPFIALAHVLDAALYRGRRRARSATARRAAVRIAAAAAAAGYPDLPVELLASRLLQDDNGPVPYTGVGREPYQPLRTWELATADPSIAVTVTRDGAPETTRVSAATVPARRDGAP
ncbi:hypothetical protein EDF27_2864 [Curtobacterium sp. PhB136]|nr:hypothetical protein EDF27_2864 [Curtobacterium sp. PhB136]